MESRCIPRTGQGVASTLVTTGGDDGLDVVRGWIRDARRVVVLTGAGISTESGIRDFRGPNGLWTKDPEAEKALAHLATTWPTPRCGRRAWRGRLETRRPRARAERRPPRPRRPRAVGSAARAAHAERRRPPPRRRLRPGARSSRSTAPSARSCCLDCGERAPMERGARPRAGRRGGPAVPQLRRDPEVGHDQLRPGPRRRTTCVRADDAARHVRPAARPRHHARRCYPIADVVPLAASHGARIVIVNQERTEMDDLADAVLRGVARRGAARARGRPRPRRRVRAPVTARIGVVVAPLRHRRPHAALACARCSTTTRRRRAGSCWSTTARAPAWPTACGPELPDVDGRGARRATPGSPAGATAASRRSGGRRARRAGEQRRA